MRINSMVINGCFHVEKIHVEKIHEFSLHENNKTNEMNEIINELNEVLAA